MSLDTILIQKTHGEFHSPNAYAAWKGFDERGCPIEFFTWPDLRDGRVPISPERMIVGGSGTLIFAFEKLGVRVPTIVDLPEELSEFRGRHVWTTTMGDIRERVESEASPIFVKPLDQPKAFPGTLVSAFRDLIPLARFTDEMRVLVSEPVVFVAEWRFFVLQGEVIGSGHHSGDPLIFPDASVVSRAVECWKPNSPRAYGIDFGVTHDGRTVMVEVNDAYSLGSLGLKPVRYSRLLETRWIELMESRSKTHTP